MDSIYKQFTVAFIIGPDRYIEFYNAWSSMMELDPPAMNTILVFQPYDAKSYEQLFDLQEIRQSNIIKINYFKGISWAWNQSIILSQTPYVLICNDDIIFTRRDVLEQIYEKHQEGYKIVHATENWSAFSIDKELIPQIGWFDEKLIYSWEDIDYRYRMERNNIKDYRFEPHLIRHLRCQKGRRQDYWNQSSLYFFKKWGLCSPKYNDAEARKQLQASGFFRKTDPNYLIPNFVTENFYPNELKGEVRTS